MAASRCGEHDNPKVAYAKTPPDTLGSLGVTNITRRGLGHVLVRILPVYCFRHEKFAGTEALGAEGIYYCIHSRRSKVQGVPGSVEFLDGVLDFGEPVYTRVNATSLPIVSHSIPERPLGPPNRVGKYITTKSAIFWGELAFTVRSRANAPVMAVT